jgi:hypothetical protein
MFSRARLVNVFSPRPWLKIITPPLLPEIILSSTPFPTAHRLHKQALPA